jgi:hypothetical protein
MVDTDTDGESWRASNGDAEVKGSEPNTLSINTPFHIITIEIAQFSSL